MHFADRYVGAAYSLKTTPLWYAACRVLLPSIAVDITIIYIFADLSTVFLTFLKIMAQSPHILDTRHHRSDNGNPDKTVAKSDKPLI